VCTFPALMCEVLCVFRYSQGHTKGNYVAVCICVCVCVCVCGGGNMCVFVFPCECAHFQH